MLSSLRSKSSRKQDFDTRFKLELIAVTGLPEIVPGDDLSQKILQAAAESRISFLEHDILVIAQKIVSKSENAIRLLSSVSPSPKARSLAKRLKKDPRLVEIVLRESRRVLRSERVLITETRHGFICANAGVDHSNVPGHEVVTLLPRDPDRSARKIAGSLRKCTGKKIAVIISDTFGRPWRLGLTNVALGAAGFPVLFDLRGTRDRTGKLLTATVLAVADELCSAAGLLMSKSTGIPAVIIRGFSCPSASQPASKIIRPAKEDLFR
jgi:coenzyme F420-0:L-glutamate ligase / coenzyme F420-1:gamma-L-glutamate ligase